MATRHTTPPEHHRPLLVPAVVLTLLCLVAVAFGKHHLSAVRVELDHDGTRVSIVTAADTVGELLIQEGIDASEPLTISPSPAAELTNRMRVTIRRAPGPAAAAREATLAASRSVQRSFLDQAVPLRPVVIVDGNTQPRRELVVADTVGQAVHDLGIDLGPTDLLSPVPETPLTAGTRIAITRYSSRIHRESERIPFRTIRVTTPRLPSGTRKVIRHGRDGVRVRTTRVSTVDGTVTRSEPLDTKTHLPVHRKILIGTRRASNVQSPIENPAAASTRLGGRTSVWDRLAQCESGGDWGINTGNGYYGGLQFSLSTWRAYGGTGYPHEHSRDTQIAVAVKLRDALGGYGSWPACSTKLGLPR